MERFDFSIYNKLSQSAIKYDISPLTHWGRVTHIRVCKLAIIWTNTGILLSYTFSFKKMHLKMLSGKWRPFCLSLNVLNLLYLITAFTAVSQQYPLLLQIITFEISFIWNLQSFIEIVIDILYTIPGDMPLFSYVHDYKGFYLYNMGYCCPPIGYVTLVTIAETIVLVPYLPAQVIATNLKSGCQ